MIKDILFTIAFYAPIAAFAFWFFYGFYKLDKEMDEKFAQNKKQ